uniref:Nuclear protein MDM1 n=1 Tax=Callorhinchus milii TaxID=7868 RepID=A0A4W3I6Q4_CALMI
LHLPLWAGLPSEQLGNTREPSFISKKRVPYYRPQVSKSFQWDWNSNSGQDLQEPKPKESQPVKSQTSVLSEGMNAEDCKTPEAPRSLRFGRSRSMDCRLHSALEPPMAGDKPQVAEAQKSKKDNNTPPKKEGADEGIANGVSVVLQKKSGLKTAPRKNLARSSEYQRQFSWKTQMENSPLLVADQVLVIIYCFKAPCKMEYLSPFEVTPLPKGPCLRKDFNFYSLKQTPSSSKQVGARIKEQESEQLLKQQNPHKPPFPHKGHGKIKSEYRTNYLSPDQYQYREGAWKAKRSFVAEEIKELREKAEVYKRRALGTHFSRDHLSQILSPENKLWELSSTSTSEESVCDSVRALDLERARETPKIPRPKQQRSHSESAVENAAPSQNPPKFDDTGKNGISNVPTFPVRQRLAWNDEEGETAPGRDLPESDQEESDGVEKELGNAEEVGAVSKRKEDPIDEANLSTANLDSNETSELGSEVGGRLPTPKLKTMVAPRRTHHDLTTPAVGGAVLVSPYKIRSPSPHRKRNQAPLGKSYSPYRCFSSGSPKKKLTKTESLQQSPAAGIRTPDPIPLREECWIPNTPGCLKTIPSVLALLKPDCTFDEKSASVPASPEKGYLHRIQGTLRNPEFQHNVWDMTCACDYDRLSQISARSAASSTLASQVLERAQMRRDSFWGKNPRNEQ